MTSRENTTLKRIVGLALGVVGVWLLLDNVVLDLSDQKYTDEESASDETKSVAKSNRKSARSPASVIERQRRGNMGRAPREENVESPSRANLGGGGASNFAPEYADSYPAPASGSPAGGGRNSGGPDSSYDNYQPSSFARGGGSSFDSGPVNSAPTSADSSTLASNTAGGTNVPFVGAPVMPGFTNEPSESDTVLDEKDDNKTGGVQGTTESVPLTCSANLNGGTFPSAINVGLSCSTSAEIKYCVSSGACCDPEVSGTVYTGNITIGNTDGNYCLSFFGRSDTIGKTSPVIDQTYTINQDVPDINSMFVQRYFQTTQLTAMNYLESSDFSKDGFMAGQVNLGGIDPSPAGLNLSCQTLMTDTIYADSPEYSFTTLLAEMSIEGLLATQALQIPMTRPELIYGENNIVTYMANNNGPLPVYGCSMNKVYLSDFEYFQAELAFGDDPNANGVREFSGGLNPYGFVDVDNTNLELGRAPASLVNQDQGGQELKVGLFGIFF